MHLLVFFSIVLKQNTYYGNKSQNLFSFKSLFIHKILS